MHCNDPVVRHDAGTGNISETGYVSKRLSAMHCNTVRCASTVPETGPVLKLLYTPWNIKKKKKTSVPFSNLFGKYGFGKYGSGKSGSGTVPETGPV